MDQDATIGKLLHTRRFGWRQGVKLCALTFVVLSVLMVSGLVFAYLHFRNNDNSDFLRERVLTAITNVAGRDAKIGLDRAGMAFTGIEPVFSLAGLKVESPEAGYSVAIGRLDLGLSSGSMFRLALDPTRLSVSEVDLVLPGPGAEQDAVERASAALASIAGLADLIASVPNLQAVDVPRVAVSRRGRGAWRCRSACPSASISGAKMAKSA